MQKIKSFYQSEFVSDSGDYDSVLIERRFVIGYVKDGSYISVKTGNITVGVENYRYRTTYSESSAESRVTGYSIVVS